MEAKSRYNLGQIVYPINREQKQVKNPCPACLTIGYFKGADGTRHTCTSCYGKLTVSKFEPVAWQLYSAHYFLTIGQIRIQLTGEGEATHEQETIYMCEESGIGGGTLWDEWRLYPTREEAQAECDKRNAEALQNA